MAGPSLKLGMLQECASGELVKVRINESVEWALVGGRGQGVSWLVVLSGPKAFTAINMAPQGHIDGDFERYPVIRFGEAYTFAPNQRAACQIANGDLFSKPGSLVVSEKGSCLVVRSENNKSMMRYVDLAFGVVGGEPGGQRAAFAAWTLYDDTTPPHEARDVLIQHKEHVPGG
ncbi:MAG: hypothetical protein J0H17_09920 [Rhizobiales bacterium]|nr:hypothetical protein [Hyphomicrobiales bacterium]